MMPMQLKHSGMTRPKGAVSTRPAGMQAIDLAMYQQIRQAVQELARPPRRRAA